MHRRNKTARMMIAAAGGVVLASGSYGLSAPTLWTYYSSGEIATNANFTTGVQNVSISNTSTSPTVFVPLGDYFEFGLSLELTNNPNGAAGMGNPAQPANLGLATISYAVSSTDTNGSMLQPLISSTMSIGNTPGGQPMFPSTEIFSQSAPADSQQGDVEIGAGGVGDYTAIFQGDFTAPTGTTAAGVARLALWSGSTPSPNNSTPWFIDLGYKALGAGKVTLSPGNSNAIGVDYFADDRVPSQSNPYGYGIDNLGETGGTGNILPPGLVVYIEPSLIWDGHTNSLWNTTTGNWNNAGNTTSDYADPDFVTLDDTGPSNATNITLNTTVSPQLVTVNSNTNNYSISGSGSIGGSATLVKEGNSILTLSTVNKYTGPTTVSAGTLIVNTNGAVPTNNALTITGGKVKLATSTGLATLSSLTISGTGVLDIGNNHVIINYGSSDPKATIIQYLQSGYNGGGWNGPGIDSSAAAANSAYGVGFGDGADGVVAGLSSGQIELKYTLYGDVNLNGVVDGTDFAILAANFNKGVTNGWEAGDFEYKGVVDGTDFGLLAANFNKGASGADAVQALDEFAAANGLLADVPEPASLGIVGLIGGTLLYRRRNGRISTEDSSSKK